MTLSPFLIIVLTIVIFAIGFFIGRLGRKKKTGTQKSKSEMTEMREEAHKALKERTEKRKSRIMNLTRKQGRITNDDVEDMFCISDNTARKYLNDLEGEGKLKQHGESGRGVYYTPTGNIQNT